MTMTNQEIKEMFEEQKKMFLSDIKLTEDDVVFDYKSFKSTARKLGWDTEVHLFAKRKDSTVKTERREVIQKQPKLKTNTSVSITEYEVNTEQLALLFVHQLSEGYIDEEDPTYLQIMLKEAKEKAEFFGTHYSCELDRQELIKILTSVRCQVDNFEFSRIPEYIEAFERWEGVKFPFKADDPLLLEGMETVD